MAALAGALLATGCGERTVVVRDDGGRVLVEARLPESGRFALEYRHSYYRVPAREEFRAGGSGFRMVAVSSPSEAVLDYYAIDGRQAARRLVDARARAPAALRAPAADRHREGPPHARGRRPPLSALRRRAAASHDRGRGGDMAVADQQPIDVDTARRGLRGREARPPPRPDPREDRPGRVRRAVAVRDLLGAQPGPGAALPHELPRRGARDDVPRLPRLGQAQGGRGDRAAGDHGLAAGDQRRSWRSATRS